jgi:heme/copper-type cytochrome/quinol oxidase subunit 3
VTAVAADVRVAPPGAARRRSKPLAWWGMMTIIATESMVFVGLLSSYLFLRASSQQWPPPGIPLPEIPKTAFFSVLLIGSSLPVIWGERGIKQGRQFQLRLGWGVAWLMAAAFVGNSIKDFLDLHYGWSDNAYASIFYAVVGLHLAHVIVALILSLGVQAKAWSNRYDERHHLTVEVVGLYWHFVDIVWIFVFGIVFVSEHYR